MIPLKGYHAVSYLKTRYLLVSSLLTKIRDFKRQYFASKYAEKYGDKFLINGLEVIIPKTVSPNIRYLLAKGRPYEVDEIELVSSVLRHGNNVLELGGSLGLLSRVMRNKIGPLAQHLIVEADPNLISICRKNAIIDSEKGKTEVLHRIVAYSREQSIAFEVSETAHSGKIADKNAKNTIQVGAITLSQLLEKMSEKKELVLVSDIEGAEYEMFQTEPRETFCKLSKVIVEIHPKQFMALGKSEEGFLKILREKGLSIIKRRENVLLLECPTK